MNHNTTHTQIAIIGGGVSGICTAYFLALVGYEVAIIERHSNVAEEATLGNSGLMAPASISPLALPGLISTGMSSRFSATPAILTQSGLNPSRWSWQRKSRSQTKHAYIQNKEHLTRLNNYGKSLIHAVQKQHALEHENVAGVLRVFRKPADLERAASTETILQEHELKFSTIAIDQIKAIEPTYVEGTPLAGARFYPQDETGNCVLFVKQLKNIIQGMGVQFHFDQNVTAIERHSNNTVTIHCGDHTINAEAVVVSAGINSAALLKQLDITLPLYAAESYTALATLKTTDYSPSVAFIDETNRVSITRLGNRLRLSGLIGFVPNTQTPHPKAVHSLHKIANDFFPHAVNYNTASIWSRTFGLTPNGLPLLGTTSYGNIFVNTGHGVNGWASAVATAKLLTDHIMDNPADIDTTGLFSHM